MQKPPLLGSQKSKYQHLPIWEAALCREGALQRAPHTSIIHKLPMIQYITATNTNDMKHKTYAHITQVTIT